MVYLRKLLWPFSIVYGTVAALRNWFFNKGLKRSFRFDFPVICVGNLSTGGTGKTPHIEYLISLLKNKYTVGVVSRGYGRNSKGFFMVDENATPQQVGDEPLQIKQNHPDAFVAVGEQRILAIPALLTEAPNVQVVLLDDAYQHRYVKAGLYILLTDYSKMFYNDFVLPLGNLREFRAGYKRAEIIVVTKCPPALGNEEKTSIVNKIKPLPHQQVFFSYLQYGQPYLLHNRETLLNNSHEKDVLFFAGIANTQSIKSYIDKNFNANSILKLPDHVNFTAKQLEVIEKQFDAIATQNKILLTTQKDAVKLQTDKLKALVSKWPLYVLPLEIRMSNEEKQHFYSHIETYIQNELSTL